MLNGHDYRFMEWTRGAFRKKCATCGLIWTTLDDNMRSLHAYYMLNGALFRREPRCPAKTAFGLAVEDPDARSVIEIGFEDRSESSRAGMRSSATPRLTIGEIGACRK